MEEIKSILVDIKKEIKDLRTLTENNYDDLKQQVLELKSNTTTQIKALENVARQSNQRIEQHTVEIDDIKKSQQFISAQYENTKKNSENLIKRNTDLKNENEQLNNKIKDLERRDKQHYATLNNQEQYTRREMVEVNGIPNVPNENTKEIILNLAKKMNIKLNPSSFDVIHRLSDKDFAPIIIKFSTRTDRNVFYDARSQLKNLTIQDLGYDPNPNTKNKIYINESLTKKNKIVYKAAREECTKLNYRYCWTKNGGIYARKNETSHVIRINLEEDVRKIK